MKADRYFIRSLMATTCLAASALVLPCAAQAATLTWVGTTSNDWGTATNWTGTPAGPPTTTSAVVINNNTNNPVQLNASTSLNGTTGSLSVGNGAGSGDSLNINNGVTLTMGARPITLNGGSITATGTGAISGTGAVTGFGTFSAPCGFAYLDRQWHCGQSAEP